MVSFPLNLEQSPNKEEKDSKLEILKNKLFPEPTTKMLAGIISICVGVIPIYLQISQHQVNNKKFQLDNTYKLHEMRFKDKVLEESLKKIKYHQSEMDESYPDLKAEELEKYLNNVVKDEENFKSHFYRVETFYSNIGECLKDEICYEDTVMALFRADIKEFNVSFFSLICKERKNAEDFGKNLEMFSENSQGFQCQLK